MELAPFDQMRVCRLNRIKIKNPEKWDKAKYDDFVEDAFIQVDTEKKKQEFINLGSELNDDNDNSAA